MIRWRRRPPPNLDDTVLGAVVASGGATVSDLAARLGVSWAHVSRSVGRLRLSGLLSTSWRDLPAVAGERRRELVYVLAASAVVPAESDVAALVSASTTEPVSSRSVDPGGLRAQSQRIPQPPEPKEIRS